MSTDAEKVYGLPTDSKESCPPDRQEVIVLMPDIYADEPLVKAKEIEAVDESPQEIDASDGFNPYDTASFFKR